MARPTDENYDETVDLSSAFTALDGFPHSQRVKSAMQAASRLLEYAAYEMASDQSAGDVSEIILMAARLDQAAQRIERRGDEIQTNGSRLKI